MLGALASLVSLILPQPSRGPNECCPGRSALKPELTVCRTSAYAAFLQHCVACRSKAHADGSTDGAWSDIAQFISHAQKRHVRRICQSPAWPGFSFNSSSHSNHKELRADGTCIVSMSKGNNEKDVHDQFLRQGLLAVLQSIGSPSCQPDLICAAKQDCTSRICLAVATVGSSLILWSAEAAHEIHDQGCGPSGCCPFDCS